MNGRIVAGHVSEIAAGTLRAQRFVEALRLDQAVPAEALEELRQITIEFGCESPAIGAWLCELAKRAARR